MKTEIYRHEFFRPGRIGWARERCQGRHSSKAGRWAGSNAVQSASSRSACPADQLASLSTSWKTRLWREAVLRGRGCLDLVIVGQPVHLLPEGEISDAHLTTQHCGVRWLFLTYEVIKSKPEVTREFSREVNNWSFWRRRLSMMRLKARFQEWMISLLERRYSGFQGVVATVLFVSFYFWYFL